MHVDNKIQCAVAGCTESADTCFRRYPSVGQEEQSVVLVQPLLNFQVHSRMCKKTVCCRIVPCTVASNFVGTT